MTVVVDTSVLVDYLRGHRDAGELLERERASGPLHASEITRLEVLAGMRPAEETVTRQLLSTVVWHSVDPAIAETAGVLGRRWLPRHRGIDSADMAIAATVVNLDARLYTRNTRHFPMFADLTAPY